MYLLDTNALSEPLKRRPSPAFLERLEAARCRKKFTSVICLMEMRYGCGRRADGGKLWKRISESLLPLVEVLPVDSTVAAQAGDLMAFARGKGRPRSTEDILIAATALVHGLTLITHDRHDFGDLPPLKVEDWMTASS